MKNRVEFNNVWFVIGLNAQDNWNIISEANKDHYWLHADNVPSAHIIIEIDKIINEDIVFACQLCKTYSKKLNSFTTKFSLTQVKNLRFGSKTGEVYFKDDSKVQTFIFKI
jgi:predicted ribosome quality control (RQC) complex YloA/Tae2 family protein